MSRKIRASYFFLSRKIENNFSTEHSGFANSNSVVKNYFWKGKELLSRMSNATKTETPI